MSKKILFLITLLCAVVQGARADFSETIDIGEPRGRRTISTEHFDLEAEVAWNFGGGPKIGARLQSDPDENAILKSRDWEIITSVEISFCNEDDAKCFISGNNKTYITRKGNVCTIPNVNSKELILSTDDWRAVLFYSITVYYTDAFTVSYDGNGNTGGTVPDNARKNYNQDLTLSSNVLTRQCFTHDGWATSPNGDKVYDFGETYKANASVTLYAHWTLNNLPVENEISSVDDWNIFCIQVENGKTYIGQTVKLMQDISVTVMAGTKEHPFSGTFLGNGKKLTFMAGSSGSLFSEEYCAPFRYVNNATIQDLVVDGSIHTAKKFASGLAGHTTGTTTIKNCHVGTVVYSSVSGEGTHGGFVAYPDGDVTITGSAYTGRLLTNNVTLYCGGFVGWHNAKTIAVTHSLYAPSSSIPSGWTAIANGATFVRGGNAGSNCYYTEALGAAQGIHVFKDTPAGEIYNQITAADSKMYYQTCTVSGILSEYNYTGNIINVAPVVADADGTVLKVETDYTVAITPATVQERGDYALTINGVGNYGGSKTIPFSVTDVLIVNAEMTSMSTGRYLVSDNVTINERITINGDVVLNLGEGATLTPKKGIEVSDGNRLTINGPGSLDIFGGDNNKSGIGAVEVGEIIINGGNIKVVGGPLAAAIGGDHNNTKGGRITINGGVVKAFALLGACIGGGGTDTGKKDGGIYGVCGDVVINGGQVDVATTINLGIGPGLEYNEPYHNSGTLTLGWTNPDDYIKYGNFATRQKSSLNSFTFADGKMFILEGTNTIATASNIANAKLVPAAVLFDKSDNSTLLSDWEGKPLPALLADRTLYKDGKWNTLCLPFSTKLADSPLEGAIARPLTAASITGTTLNLTFGDAVDVLVAGTPYIIKWTRADDYVDDDAHNIVNPLFKGVTIDAADHSYDNAASGDLRVRFLGTYKSTEFDGTDKSILLMGGNNTLYYPASDAGLGAQRAYFKIGSDGAARTRSITAFNMSFGGDDETTGIISIANQGDRSLDSLSQSDQALIRWYTIDGRRLSGKPSRAGVYVNNGKKVVIK